MVKRAVGLPENFTLNIPPVDEPPVRLGDYLEEEEAPPPPTTPTRRAAPARGGGVLSMPKPPPAPPAQQPAAIAPAPTPKKKRPEIPRREFNISANAAEMMQELLLDLRTQGPQRDASGSELFEALLTALHEARRQIDYSRLAPRGRWGSPTAKAFITELKNAYQRAVQEHLERQTQAPTAMTQAL